MSGYKNEIVCWTCRHFSKSEKGPACRKYSVELPQIGYEIFCNQYRGDSANAQEPIATFSQRQIRGDVLYFYSYAVGPAPFELASMTALKSSKFLPAAIRIESQDADASFARIEIKKNAPDLNEISVVLDDACCKGKREDPAGSSLDRHGKAIYMFNPRDQALISEWLFRHYRRDKIYSSWRSKPMLKNYGVHAFMRLQYNGHNLKSMELLEDGLANAVMYGGSGPSSL